MDPRVNRHGELDICLTSLGGRAWQKEDAPPTRVKPLPLAVVAQVWALAHGETSPQASAAATCLIYGFYFLLRPGEYLGPPRQATGGPSFRMRDVQF